MVFGGVIASAYGWRTAFLIAGLPGVVIGLLVLLTVRDPRSLLKRHLASAAAKGASFKKTLRHLKARPTFWIIAGSAAFKSMIGYGHAPFTASFFLRSHTSEITLLSQQLSDVFGTQIKPIGFLGLALGLGLGLGGVAGTIIGGYLADRLAKRDIRAYMTLPAYSVLAAVPVFLTALLVDSAIVALLLLCLNAFLTAFWYGPVFSTAQAIALPEMRAKTAAILLLIVNLFGLGLGPLGTGILSDLINRAGYGEAEGLRLALICITTLAVVPFFGFLAARRTIEADVQD